METNTEKPYGSGDHSNQRPIIPITKKTQKKTLVYKQTATSTKPFVITEVGILVCKHLA